MSTLNSAEFFLPQGCAQRLGFTLNFRGRPGFAVMKPIWEKIVRENTDTEVLSIVLVRKINNREHKKYRKRINPNYCRKNQRMEVMVVALCDRVGGDVLKFKSNHMVFSLPIEPTLRSSTELIRSTLIYPCPALNTPLPQKEVYSSSIPLVIVPHIHHTVSHFTAST